MRDARSIAVLTLLLGLLSGCNVTQITQLEGAKPDLRAIYEPEAIAMGAARNPIIVIHGVLGSRLKDSESGRPVWGSFTQDAFDSRTPQGARLLALPIDRDVPLREVTSSTVVAGPLDRVEVGLLGVKVGVAAYADLLRTLGAGGYSGRQIAGFRDVEFDEQPSSFAFSYDWRRSNAENAARLAAFIEEKRREVQADYEKRFGLVDHDVKFDIVAHSMGGLVTRYYLRYGDQPLDEVGPMPTMNWAGAEHVEKVILVGTPNLGFSRSFRALNEGLEIVPFLLPRDEPAILATMPSWYQMLPRPRHDRLLNDATGDPLNVYDLDLWDRMGWGLLDPQQDGALRILLPNVEDAAERRRIARRHTQQLLTVAQRFHEAIDAPPVGKPSSLSIVGFCGDALPTPGILRINPETGRIVKMITVPGDGICTRAGVIGDDRTPQSWRPRLVSPVAWDEIVFLRTGHMGMTADPSFTNNMLYHLLLAPRP